MAVKFSEFTQETVAGNVTRLVGYTATGDLNIQIPPDNLDTTYALSTSQDGSNVDLTFTGTKTGTANTTEVLQYTASNATALTAGTDEITIASTAYALTATDSLIGANNVPVVLTGTGGGDSGTDTVSIVGAGTVAVSSASNVLTITGTSTSDVDSINQTAGSASTGTPITVAGTGTGPFTGTVTIAANTYAGAGNVGIVPTGGSAGKYLDGASGSWITLPAGYTSWTLSGDSGANQTISDGNTVDISGGTGITTTTSATDVLTITANTYAGAANVGIVPAGGSAGKYLDGASGSWITLPSGDTYDLNASASGNNVNLNLTSGSGSDNSTVLLTAGTGITLTRLSGTNIEIESAAGVSKTVDTFIISGTSTNSITVTSTTNPTNSNFIDVYVDGVYQSKVNFSALSGKTLTLASGVFPDGSTVEAVTTT